MYSIVQYCCGAVSSYATNFQKTSAKGGYQVTLSIIGSLAKLNKVIKIADISNQRKTERKAFLAIAIAFGADAKPFNKANDMLNQDG